jgi:hypothetical protein
VTAAITFPVPSILESALRPGILLVFVGLIVAERLPAQEGGSPSCAPIIHSVEIRRQDVFDSVEARNWITRTANHLHAVTRSATVEHELLLHPGDTYDSAAAAETARNLRRLGIFRDVRIGAVCGDSGLVLQVLTKDGWSTKVDLSFRSTAGQVAFAAGLFETNLLGTATSTLLKYRKNPDRSTVQVGFQKPRLIARSVGILAQYENRSDGHQAIGRIDYPFFALASRRGAHLDVQTFHGRVLRFTNGRPVASDSLQRRYVLVLGEGAMALQASNSGYLRLGLTAQLRRDDFAPQPVVGPIPRTLSGAAGPFLEVTRAAFLVTHGFQNFQREEDVDISPFARFGVFVAPKSWGYARTGLGPHLRASIGSRLPSGFGYLEANAGGLYTSAGLDSGTVQVGGTMVLEPASGHLILGHIEGGWQKNPYPGEEFDLGLGIGPRAFRAHAFTGDRSYFATAEYRWTIVPELWKVVGIGIAGFVDHGGAWFAGHRRRTGTDAGIGLRLSSSREADVQAVRIDLARQFPNDVEPARWVVSIGKGFVFAPIR